MATVATLAIVSLRNTPYEWYFKAKDLVSSGELSEKEVDRAFDALIRAIRLPDRIVTTEVSLTPCWSDICYCMVQGWLSRREVGDVLRVVVESKRFCPGSVLERKKDVPFD